MKYIPTHHRREHNVSGTSQASFCLEERLLDIEIPSIRFNNITKEEREALYSLKDDPSIMIKGADKVSLVAVWDREDYLKETYR